MRQIPTFFLTTCVIGLYLLLAGCATLPQPARLLPAQIRAFVIEGRLIVHQTGHESISHISWQHTADQDDILLTTSLGIGLARFVRDHQGARLILADKREFQANDWDDLSHRIFGTTLPLTALPQWLVANVPPPAHPDDLDMSGRPRSRTLQGWQIRYDQYESEAPHALPIDLSFTRTDPEPIKLRLKIDEWTMPP